MPPSPPPISFPHSRTLWTMMLLSSRTLTLHLLPVAQPIPSITIVDLDVEYKDIRYLHQRRHLRYRRRESFTTLWRLKYISHMSHQHQGQKPVQFCGRATFPNSSHTMPAGNPSPASYSTSTSLNSSFPQTEVILSRVFSQTEKATRFTKMAPQCP